MTDAPTWLTTAELAARWGVKPSTVRSWRWREIGPPFFKPSGKGRGGVRYSLADVVEYEQAMGAGHG